MCSAVKNSLRNRVSDSFGTVSGGLGNVAGNLNGIINDSSLATVGGGYKNIARGLSSTISGGEWSIAQGAYATIGGGNDNSASGQFTTVGGGTLNSASGERATVGGGTSNSASGLNAVTPGGQLNLAGGDYSFAAGHRAKANHAGAFVWAGSIDADVASPTTETFSVRALGGIWLGTTNTPAIPQGRFLNTSTGAYLSLTGVWTNSSDRNAKENFTQVDPQSILAQVAALPISTWNYRTEAAEVRHMGPTAQDFSAAFGLGADKVSIGTIDADGVALAAIQGLYQLTQAQEAKIATQEAEIATLTERLAALEGQAKQGAAPSPAFPGWLALLLGLGGLAVGLVWHGRQAGGR
jgi:trimeric autotransporter adhesin